MPTNENPADFTTRSMRVSDMAKEKTWWSGPDILQKEESVWLVDQIDTNKVSEAMKIKKIAQGSSQAGQSSRDWIMISVYEDDQLWYLDPKPFSSWIKLIRVQARTGHFIDNCRKGERNWRLCDSSDKGAQKSPFQTSICHFSDKHSYRKEWAAQLTTIAGRGGPNEMWMDALSMPNSYHRTLAIQ